VSRRVGGDADKRRPGSGNFDFCFAFVRYDFSNSFRGHSFRFVRTTGVPHFLCKTPPFCAGRSAPSSGNHELSVVSAVQKYPDFCLAASNFRDLSSGAGGCCSARTLSASVGRQRPTTYALRVTPSELSKIEREMAGSTLAEAVAQFQQEKLLALAVGQKVASGCGHLAESSRTVHSRLRCPNRSGMQHDQLLRGKRQHRVRLPAIV
jgi:hypothetical protein